MLSLRTTLGSDFTPKTKEAWMTVYSSLLIQILPYVRAADKVFIKKKERVALEISSPIPQPRHQERYLQDLPEGKGASQSSKSCILL